MGARQLAALGSKSSRTRASPHRRQNHQEVEVAGGEVLSRRNRSRTAGQSLVPGRRCTTTARTGGDIPMNAPVISRREFLAQSGAGLVLLQASWLAQAFPSRPGEEVVPWLDQPGA